MKKKGIFIASILMGCAAGICARNRILGKALDKEKEISKKHLSMFLMMDQWVRVKQEGKSLAGYLTERHYNTIAVYGMSYAGRRLQEELKESGVTIKYGIDKRAEEIYADMNVVSPEDPLKEVDAVIVTSISFVDEIQKSLSGKLSCPILSLEDILYEI